MPADASKCVKTGTTVHFKKRISNFTSTTSKDPTVISKIEEAKIQKPSAAERIVLGVLRLV